jgi:hypothetical protein
MIRMLIARTVRRGENESGAELAAARALLPLPTSYFPWGKKKELGGMPLEEFREPGLIGR